MTYSNETLRIRMYQWSMFPIFTPSGFKKQVRLMRYTKNEIHLKNSAVINLTFITGYTK